MTNEEAIKNIVAYIYYAEDIPEEVGKAFDVAITALKERPQGEWIFTCIGYYKCSNCGEVERAEKNYCPNCGAQMLGGEKNDAERP